MFWKEKARLAGWGEKKRGPSTVIGALQKVILMWDLGKVGGFPIMGR